MIVVKLKLNDFQKWIKLEINGYLQIEDILSYRIVHGRCMTEIPTVGWSIVGLSGETAMRFLEQKIDCSVVKIEGLIDNKNSRKFVHYSKEIEVALADEYMGYISVLVIGNESLIDILGKNMSFSDKEKSIAYRNITIYNNYINNEKKSQFQQGNNNDLENNY